MPLLRHVVVDIVLTLVGLDIGLAVVVDAMPPNPGPQ